MTKGELYTRAKKIHEKILEGRARLSAAPVQPDYLKFLLAGFDAADKEARDILESITGTFWYDPVQRLSRKIAGGY